MQTLPCMELLLITVAKPHSGGVVRQHPISYRLSEAEGKYSCQQQSGSALQSEEGDSNSFLYQVLALSRVTVTCPYIFVFIENMKNEVGGKEGPIGSGPIHLPHHPLFKVGVDLVVLYLPGRWKVFCVVWWVPVSQASCWTVRAECIGFPFPSRRKAVCQQVSALLVVVKFVILDRQEMNSLLSIPSWSCTK